MKWLKVSEYVAWAVGFALVGFYVSARTHSASGRASDIKKFEKVRDEAITESAAVAAKVTSSPSLVVPARTLESTEPFDFTLWGEGRIKKYEDSLGADLGLPMALLRVPKINLEVAVLEGTDDVVLDRAVGRIAGTVAPGELGNSGIAGHRDGVFRGLKDIGLGDSLEIETLTGIFTYTIDRISVVDPTHVEVLNPTEDSVITLVTCYPFYFVGKAPQRYIVRASLQQPVGVQTVSAGQAVSAE